MRISLKAFVFIIGGLLFFASFVALYLAIDQEETAPLLMVALVNIIAVFTLLFLITRGILPSLQSIQRILGRVGKGDLSARVKIDSIRELNILADAVNDMVSKVEKATEEVEMARERAVEIERLKTEFLSLAAHQLRTPLSAIKWILRALAEGDVGELKGQQKDMVEKAYNSNERMIDLINDLLNVTRIEEGRYLYKPVLSDITDIVDSVVKNYVDIAKRKNITLIFKKPQQKLSRVLVDEEKIFLAFQNIIDNAIKYTPAKGTVTVAVQGSKKSVKVTVQDSGMGIPKAQQARVFGKFFRATNAERVDTEGSGLGLYLVKNIVEAHKGKVGFDSSANKGTTFTITLPSEG